jgi:Zn-dependent protease with chaperone function
MDFFESQDTARRNTGRLIVLFALSVLSLIAITNVLVMVIFGLSAASSEAAGTELSLFDWEVFLAVSLGVIAVILFGSLYKIASLSGGGARVAEMMNGRLLLPDSDDPLERRTLNVVEEMAIASGTPVPPVYVMEEAGINAFAAGYSPGDAVIGITRGAMETLTRQQLQGVIAHEFSHILHGDMRINIRLIGILHGILVLGIIGYYLLRSGAHSRRSKDSGGLALLGLGLVVIGYVGTFFGNLIKAAVSRQREYLADASAVQYTRNPEGIAGALMQIAQHSGRSYLQHPGGQEINHALFEEAGKLSLRGLYATHPPLEERIQAILPDWDGSYDLISRPEPEAASEAPEEDSRRVDVRDAMAILTGSAGAVLAGQAIGHIGQPQAGHLQYADALLLSLPKAALQAARQPSSARALVYYLLLADGEELRARQLSHLEQSADTGVFAELERLLASEFSLEPEQRLPLVEIAMTSLRQLSPPQFDLFRKNFQHLIAADGKVDLFEWCLQKYLFHHLDEVFSGHRPRRLGRQPLQKYPAAIATLLAMFSHCHKTDELKPEAIFDRGAEALQMELSLPDIRQLSYAELDRALEELGKVRPLQKPALLKACAACILADEKVMPAEVELLRTVAAILDCPMPPLLATD